MQVIPAGGWYTIVGLDKYPEPVRYIGGGQGYALLKQEMKELKGKTIGIGFEPMDIYDVSRLIDAEPVRVMNLPPLKTSRPTPSIQKISRDMKMLSRVGKTLINNSRTELIRVNRHTH